MPKGKFEYWLKGEGLTLISGWAMDGLTQEQIANNIGINVSTLYDWEYKYEKIFDALRKGKEVVDFEVERALLKRALGYTFTEVSTKTAYNPKTEKYELIETKEVTKEVQPDTTAQMFWLKNRQPLKWRDKKEVEHSGDMNTYIKDLENLSVEELRKLIENAG